MIHENFTDVRALTVIFHVRNWKMRKKFAKIFVYDYEKNSELILINMLRPTYMPNLVILAWKNEFRNVKRCGLIKQSIMHIFNEAEPPWSNLSEILG